MFFAVPGEPIVLTLDPELPAEKQMRKSLLFHMNSSASCDIDVYAPPTEAPHELE